MHHKVAKLPAQLLFAVAVLDNIGKAESEYAAMFSCFEGICHGFYWHCLGKAALSSFPCIENEAHQLKHAG
jgi:hypothetical protein